MRYMDNQRGIALMMVLVISVIVLAVMSTMLYMLTTGTKVSGIRKRYTSALEAATGGKAVVMDFIREGDVPELAEDLNMFVTNSGSSCLDQKLNLSTKDWDSTCDSSLFIDPSDPTTYDVQFDLDSYTVYAKIVNTVEGNSARGLLKGTRGVVHSQATSGARMPHIPYYYSVEMDARNKKNPAEKSRVSILYEY